MLWRGAHLTYCLNIHPGERLADVRTAIRGPVAAVKARIAPDRPFGVGLRLSARAAEELEGGEAAFRGELEAAGLYAFTVNGFPYGRFHGARVKEDVYRPDWTTPERVRYTLRLARILAALLPPGLDGSISTSPLVYGKSIPAAAVANLLTAGRGLARIAADTGKTVRLAIEPEPDCAVETTAEALALFERLRSDGDPGAAALLGVCLDTCHLAVNFEAPAESLHRLEAAGIPVPKIQLSAALRLAPGADPEEALGPFAEPVYLHQTRVRGPDGVRRHPDLAPALAARAPGEWRVHFHVPLHTAPRGGLSTTAGTIDAAFLARAATPGRHLEVETYSFDVLPGPRGPVEESVVSEIRWVLDRS